MLTPPVFGSNLRLPNYAAYIRNTYVQRVTAISFALTMLSKNNVHSHRQRHSAKQWRNKYVPRKAARKICTNQAELNKNSLHSHRRRHSAKQICYKHLPLTCASSNCVSIQLAITKLCDIHTQYMCAMHLSFKICTHHAQQERCAQPSASTLCEADTQKACAQQNRKTVCTNQAQQKQCAQPSEATICEAAMLQKIYLQHVLAPTVFPSNLRLPSYATYIRNTYVQHISAIRYAPTLLNKNSVHSHRRRHSAKQICCKDLPLTCANSKSTLPTMYSLVLIGLQAGSMRAQPYTILYNTFPWYKKDAQQQKTTTPP